MGGRGGGLLVKEEEDIEIDIDDNYNKKGGGGDGGGGGRGGGISIAERRLGFNAASSINAGRFSFFTVPPGLSPSALLDSPVMLHDAQGQLSPTTGTFQFREVPPSTIAAADHQNKPFEEFEMKQVSRKAAIGHQEKHEKTSIEDGYLWRKYGQKHVKGSEYPRSYYKCTNPNCSVTKKVERCDQGQVSEIVYKGSHNHPEPLPSLKKNVSELGVPICNSTLDDATNSSFHLASLPTSTTPPTTTTTLDQPDHLSDQSVSNDADENGDLISEPRKRKRETSYPNGSESGAPRCAREPKVVVQIESDIDILDDGYRWRKYGQKVVKGNPNPRSYYKCTTPGCGVRKHVERAANDIKSVITTYEGKHNHQVPSSKSLQVINSQSHSHHHNSSSSSSSVRLDHSAKQHMNVVDEEVAAVYLERKAYPLSFPPFHSLPAYPPSLLASSTSKLYPLIPDYHVSSLLPSHINPHHLPPSPPPNLFHYNNVVYPSISTTSRDNNSHNMDVQVIPKEEQRDHDDVDGLYDACLSLPNHPNATI